MKNLSPFLKTIIWTIGNIFFGLAPLVLIFGICQFSTNDLVNQEMNHLLRDGIVLFLCSAIMGAVTWDTLTSNFKIQSSWTYFFLFISPFAVLGILLIVYLLNVLKILDIDLFAPFSILYWFVLPVSALYTLISKFYLFKMEKKQND